MRRTLKLCSVACLSVLLLSGCAQNVPVDPTISSTEALTTEATTMQKEQNTSEEEPTTEEESTTKAEVFEYVPKSKTPEELGLNVLKAPMDGLYIYMPYEDAAKVLEEHGVSIKDCEIQDADQFPYMKKLSYSGEIEACDVKASGFELYFSIPGSMYLTASKDMDYSIESMHLESIRFLFPEAASMENWTVVKDELAPYWAEMLQESEGYYRWVSEKYADLDTDTVKKLMEWINNYGAVGVNTADRFPASCGSEEELLKNPVSCYIIGSDAASDHVVISDETASGCLFALMEILNEGSK